MLIIDQIIDTRPYLDPVDDEIDDGDDKDSDDGDVDVFGGSFVVDDGDDDDNKHDEDRSGESDDILFKIGIVMVMKTKKELEFIFL